MKKYVSIMLCLCLGIGTLISEASASFPDVDENAPYAEAVEYLNEIGIMTGDTSGNFNPDKTVTRAQMAAIICRMLDETENLPTDGSRFTDVPESYWANGYVVKVAELSIISGYGNGTFRPENPVTYEQVVTMLVRTIYGNEDAEKNGGYPDGFLYIAKENGLLENISFKRGELLARSDIASLLFNYYNMSISG